LKKLVIARTIAAQIERTWCAMPRALEHLREIADNSLQTRWPPPRQPLLPHLNTSAVGRVEVDQTTSTACREQRPEVSTVSVYLLVVSEIDRVSGREIDRCRMCTYCQITIEPQHGGS
jgi:hypothetical protein